MSSEFSRSPRRGDFANQNKTIDPAIAQLRVPPHSIEAEQSVLGGLLLASGVIGAAGFGVSAIRNGYERRGELVVLRAIGFEAAQLRRLLQGKKQVLRQRLLQGRKISARPASREALDRRHRKVAAVFLLRHRSWATAVAGRRAPAFREAIRVGFRRRRPIGQLRQWLAGRFVRPAISQTSLVFTTEFVTSALALFDAPHLAPCRIRPHSRALQKHGGTNDGEDEAVLHDK